MKLSQQIARQVREMHFGGNWTGVNLRDTLADISFEEATTKVGTFNSIAALVFHINYYIVAVTRVLEGGPLDASDRFSFDLPPIDDEAGWNELREKTWADASHIIALIEALPDTRVGEDFDDDKYGSWYRNLLGVVEHTHYHLGQIVLLKKWIRSSTSTSTGNEQA